MFIRLNIHIQVIIQRQNKLELFLNQKQTDNLFNFMQKEWKQQKAIKLHI